METYPAPATDAPVRGYTLPYPHSKQAHYAIASATCAGCDQEMSGWCGGCETCNMMPTMPHTCTPEAAAVPLTDKPPSRLAVTRDRYAWAVCGPWTDRRDVPPPWSPSTAAECRRREGPHLHVQFFMWDAAVGVALRLSQPTQPTP